MAEEKVYFENGDVKVTNARFLTFGKMHSMAGVTSVAKYVISPSYKYPIITLVIGLILFAVSWIFALIVTGVAIAWIVSLKKEYQITLSSASGSEEALRSKDEAFIDEIINALNQAIIDRG
ncbi:MAG TPA: DUF6232 family protein [Bacteroidales bacterium]|jgi:hypothetical protein|nr:DUF6232 family protein [Bacteroidales bacterium]